MRMLEEAKTKVDAANTNLIQSNTDASNTNTNATTNSAQVKSKDDEIYYHHINGIGVSGIAVTFLFLICSLIGIQIMMSIFVNTKTIDEPLRMGRIEH